MHQTESIYDRCKYGTYEEEELKKIDLNQLSSLDDIDPPSKNGFYAIHAAAQSKNPNMAIQLAKKGFRTLTTPSNNGTMPIHFLISNRNFSFDDLFEVLKSMEKRDRLKLMESLNIKTYLINRTNEQRFLIYLLLHKNLFKYKSHTSYYMLSDMLSDDSNTFWSNKNRFDQTLCCRDLLSLCISVYKMIHVNPLKKTNTMEDFRSLNSQQFARIQQICGFKSNQKSEIANIGVNCNLKDLFGFERFTEINPTNLEDKFYEFEKNSIHIAQFCSKIILPNKQLFDYGDHVGIVYTKNKGEHYLMHIEDDSGIKIELAKTYFQNYFSKSPAPAEDSFIVQLISFDRFKSKFES